MNKSLLNNEITTTTTNKTSNEADSEFKEQKAGVPNPEVTPKRKNRRYSADYKLAILSEIDHCASSSEKGAIMRREGLYGSIISEWRKSRDAGAPAVLVQFSGPIKSMS